MMNLLSALRYPQFCCDTGSQCQLPPLWRKQSSQEFDVLLCDLNIDREDDGYDVIRAMREVNPRCVTIVLTGTLTWKAQKKAFV
jgi:CheY-like chemotaxis protein